MQLLRKPANAWGWVLLVLTLASLAALAREPSIAGLLGTLGSLAGWVATVLSADDADEQREKLAELERKHRDRTIDDETRQRLIAILTSRPDGPIDITSISDPEPFQYAKLLQAILKDAGWTVSDRVDSGSALGAPVVGVFLRICGAGADVKIPDRASFLQDALVRVGISCRLVRSTSRKPGVVQLVVGVKPI